MVAFWTGPNPALELAPATRTTNANDAWTDFAGPVPAYRVVRARCGRGKNTALAARTDAVRPSDRRA